MRIITDDAADFAAGTADTNNITIIPVNVAFGTEEYLSGIDITKADFYAKTSTISDANFPKTSQPTPYQYQQLYEKLIAEGETEFLTITVSKKLSGTYTSAVAAAKELEGKATFHIFDSLSASTMQGAMALEAASMLKDGADIEAIMAKLGKMRDDGRVFLVIDSLEYAVKGGRVGALRSAMASLLNIKPIMKLEDGEVSEAGKVRTSKKAIAQMVDMAVAYAGDRPVKFTVMHANEPAGAEKMAAQARPLLNSVDDFVVDLTLPVAINLGPGTLAIMVMPTD